MKQLRDYLQEAEVWATGPVAGDVFAINIREECLLETSVQEVVRNGVILEADERLLELLAQYDMLGETIRRYGPAASNRGQGFTVLEDLDNPMAQAVAGRIIRQHPEWLSQYGIEFVMQAIDDVTEGEGDWEEIGTSDVSAYVKMVHDQLKDRGGSRSDMVEGGGIDPNLHPQTRDYGRGEDDEDLPFDPDTDASDRDEFGNIIKHRARHLARQGMRQAMVQKSDEPVEEDYMPRMLELAGISQPVEETAPIQPNPNAARTDPLAAKAADLAPVGTEKDPSTATTIDEGVMKDIAIELGEIADTENYDALYDLLTSTTPAGQMVQKIADDLTIDHRLRGDDHEELLELLMDRIIDEFGGQLDEAEYQGRKVSLGKPMQGDVKKFKVYVKDPKTGNVKKVNFGDKTMRIKKSNPKRRKSFRARHNCANPGPRTKARYWSCRKW